MHGETIRYEIDESPLRGNNSQEFLSMASSPCAHEGTRKTADSLALSQSASQFELAAWGKSDMNSSKSKGSGGPASRNWLPLVTHLTDTLGVAEVVWGSMLSEQVKRAVCVSGEVDEARAKRIYLFMCGIHDIGKSSREFVYKQGWLKERFEGILPELNVDQPSGAVLRHEVVSHYQLGEWAFSKVMGRSASDRSEDRRTYRHVSSWGVAVGGHHGMMPSKSNGTFINFPQDREIVYQRAHEQRDEWHAHRHAIMDKIMCESGLTHEDLVHMTMTQLRSTGQTLLCAAVIVADWIASNEELCPLGPEHPPQLPDRNRVKLAVERLGIPDTWYPTNDFDTDFNSTFMKRFAPEGLPTDVQFTPRPVQDAVCAHIRRFAPVNGDMLLIVEDATGSGKTEAGLSAAEMLAYRSGARGVMVALPTMATSNAMYARVRRWMSRLGQGGEFTTQLIHSQSAMNDDHSALKRTGMNVQTNASSLCCEDSASVVHAWMTGSRRAILSDFSVGTIDQVLYAGLNRKYTVLPHFGLAQKVLVIDEVHDHDVYMRQFLVKVLRWCGAYGIPVVALSATLTPSVRAELHAAYSNTDVGSDYLLPADTVAYPLITSSSSSSDRVDVTDGIPAVERVKRVKVEMCEDDEDGGVLGLVQSVAGVAGCVGFICNTVSKAQRVYAAIRAEMTRLGWEVELLHSRFTIEDRLSKESNLVRRLGPDAGSNRPHKYILVGTQVLEQSLDVDFDVMISDLCPSSALIQRIGRLHRHNRDTRPKEHTEPKVVVTGFGHISGIPDVIKIPIGTQMVYKKCAPMLTAATLRDRDVIVTPADVPSIICDPHADSAVELIPEAWKPYFIEAAEKEKETLRTVRDKADKWLVPDPVSKAKGPHAGWDLPTTDADSKSFASVRDSVMDRTAVVVYASNDDSCLFIKTQGKLMPITGGFWKNQRTARRNVLQIARQEIRLPKSANTIRIPSLSDLDYEFNWDLDSLKWVIDPRTHVLVLDVEGSLRGYVDERDGSTVTAGYTAECGLEFVELEND